ncbi:MAG: ATP-binding cassette domain-containing protein [Burkholderiales bacterium]
MELIDISGLKHRHGTNQTAAWSLVVPTWQVERGEAALVLGPSGSGKSTLLSVLAALQKPTTGHVEVAGVQVAELDAAAADA